MPSFPVYTASEYAIVAMRERILKAIDTVTENKGRGDSEDLLLLQAIAQDYDEVADDDFSSYLQLFFAKPTKKRAEQVHDGLTRLTLSAGPDRLAFWLDYAARGAMYAQRRDPAEVNPSRNPPVWAVDEDIWARAEEQAEIARTKRGRKRPFDFYAYVTAIYKRMGGRIVRGRHRR